MLILLKTVNFIDHLNQKIAKYLAWALPILALLTFLITILRYIFSLGWIWQKELVIYFHATFFMLSMGNTLLKDQHVRVDILYNTFSPRKKAMVNLLGTLFLLIPFCIFLMVYAFPYVQSSWHQWEGSPQAGGLAGVFLLKTVILIMPFLVFWQGFALAVRSFLVLFGKDIFKV